MGGIPEKEDKFHTMNQEEAHTMLRATMPWIIPSDQEDALLAGWPEEIELVRTFGLSREQTMELMPSIDVFAGVPSYEMLCNAPRLKLVNVVGHGLDFIVHDARMRDYALEHNIIFCKAQAADIAIAEYVIASMINLARRTFKFHQALSIDGRQLHDLRDLVRQEAYTELWESTVGILGFGPIGKGIAERAYAMGMKVGVVCRHPESIERERYGVSFSATLDQLDDFLPSCDFVVIALPRTADTVDCLNRERIGRMKDRSYLVNIARGELVDDDALYEALKSGKIAGAALDVWRNRTRTDGHYPFPYPIHHFNVIMTPHFVGGTGGARRRVIRFIVENTRRFARGEPLLHVADLRAGY